MCSSCITTFPLTPDIEEIPKQPEDASGFLSWLEGLRCLSAGVNPHAYKLEADSYNSLFHSGGVVVLLNKSKLVSTANTSY